MRWKLQSAGIPFLCSVTAVPIKLQRTCPVIALSQAGVATLTVCHFYTYLHAIKNDHLDAETGHFSGACILFPLSTPAAHSKCPAMLPLCSQRRKALLNLVVQLLVASIDLTVVQSHAIKQR
jgi:hypothetical protein